MECVASGDHRWAGTSQCQDCGHRLRCNCGVYVREDNIDTHMQRCPWLERAIEAERRDMEARMG